MAHPPNNHPRFSKPTLDSTGKTHSTTPTSTTYNLTSHFSTLNQKPTKSHYPFPVKPQKITKQGEMESSKSDNNKSLVIVKERENEVVKQKVVKMVNVKRGLYCDGQVELVNFLAKNCAKVVSVDMPSVLQIHAVGFARKIKDSLEKFSAKTLALSLKKEFDGAYGPAWHCIVGTSFGSFVTHSVGGFLYFSLDQKLYILLFKTTVQRAD